MPPTSCLIDDFGPVPVVRPASVEELSDRVRRAAAEKLAVYPLGGRTMLGLGLPPTRPGIGFDMTGLAEVIDYPARDMTITVQAGITVACLQTLLKTENQRLPVDVPRPAQATLGGVLAANVSGLRRHGFGTLRDYVIGISVVNDEGHSTKAGGRVVKNVAGYDLCKLYVGSLGTLGIIQQVTLKLRPLPEERALVLISCVPNQVRPLLEELHRTRTRPVGIELLNESAVGALPDMPRAPRVLAVGFEEKEATVAWQVEQLTRELSGPSSTAMDARLGAASDALWHALAELPLQDSAALSFKANVLPSAAADFFEKAAALPDGLLLQAHAGNGIVFGHAPAGLTLEPAASMLTLLHEWAATAKGNVVVTRCPTAWKATLPIWGRPREDAWLMKAVKDKLDPAHLFNPGRFLV